jgi:hypothetical protein
MLNAGCPSSITSHSPWIFGGRILGKSTTSVEVETILSRRLGYSSVLGGNVRNGLSRSIYQLQADEAPDKVSP